MAVAYRSGNTVTNGSAGTSVTVAKPAGMTETGVAGADVMVAFVATVGAPTVTAPAGWTLIASVASGSAMTLKAYWKLASSEGASFTWTLGTAQLNLGWVAAYTGADPTAPVYDYSYDDALTSSTVLIPGVPQDAVQNPYGLGIGVGAAIRAATGVATTWTHSSTERVDLSTNAGAGTDISGVGGTAINSVFRSTYTPTLTASQTQTAGVALGVTLKPYFVPYTGALNGTGVVVEAAFGVDPDSDSAGWSWTDLTPYVLANSKLGMRHGRADRATVADPSELSFTLLNLAGAFTLPTGLFRQTLTRNVPIRVRVTGFGYTSDLPLGYHRGTFFVSGLRPRWDTTTNFAVIDVVASGRLRKLQHAEESDVSAARAALARAIGSGGTYVSPVGYWPFEDEAGASSAASTSGNVRPATVTQVTFAGDSSAVGSKPLATLGASSVVTAAVPSPDVVNRWRVVFVVQVPTEPVAATTLLTVGSSSPFGVASWRIYVTPGTSAIAVDATSYVGAVTTASVAIDEALFYGKAVMVTLLAQQSTFDIAFDLRALWDAGAGLAPAEVAASGTLSSLIIGPVINLTVVGQPGLIGAGFGHLAVYDNAASRDEMATAILTGNAGEWPWYRFQRLCAERGVPNFAVPSASTILQMGPQPVADFMTQLRECETVEGCVLNDSGVNSSTGLLWFPARDQRENIKATLNLDVDLGQVAPGFEAIFDDQNLVNDVEVSRAGGSSARVEDADSIAAEGRYPFALTVNTDDDVLLSQIAGLHVAAGTAKGFRFPSVRWDMRGSPELAEQWLNTLLFHRIDIAHPPTQYPPETISAILEGYTEIISADTWMVQANLSTYQGHVGIMAEATGDARTLVARMVGDSAAALRGNLTTSTTSIPFDPNRARYTLVADDYTPNLRMRVAGETIDMSACATTAATFVATGTVAHANNASVTPTLPAGATTNDLLLVFAAIRNSGAGLPVAPTGYTRLAVFDDTDNCQLFAKVCSASESDPTVTFTGGIANADSTAQMIALRNMPITLTDLADIVVGSAAQLNASAQDIAYPQLMEMNQDGAVVLVLGWKQDDWTSVAALSGFTEIDEPDTTTGNDQGIVWDYVIQTGAAYIGAGSFVVTGGAAAISRGAVVALAGGFQTFTAATRAVNGVSKSHTAGTLVEVDDPGVMGM